MSLNHSLAFIGAGNMAGYIIQGLLKNNYPANKIIATHYKQETLEKLRKNLPISFSLDNKEAVEKADIIFICVKPKHVKKLLHTIASSLKTQLIISIAAGIDISHLQQWSQYAYWIRMMPNLPISVQKGTLSLFANSNIHENHKAQVTSLFSQMSRVFWLEKESLLNITVALAGSGPAYFYLFIEALSHTAHKLGLDAKIAEEMAKETAIGALILLQKSAETPKTLRENVTSPGGTTEAALNIFKNNHFYDLVEKALTAAMERSIALNQCD